ncbi:ATP-binding protein [Kordia algicida OT-1]|uniref:histidine kinase n=1 Tax=Kordia algicida OT-1 TaxID=391587 RepID=A9E8J4_9FLAO|nr:ATP-binding protein [Kordia algicida]EDP94778.1 two-component sensor histidine kinase [Kordia algicida OT-1]
MEYKNITNQDVVNLENCEDEPIHIPGRIQPHGFLISVKSATDVVNVCSENIHDYLRFTHEDVLGKNIAKLFNDDFLKAYKSFKEDTATSHKEFNFSFDDTLFSICIHLSDQHIIIEGEPTENQFGQDRRLYNSSKQLLGYIQDTLTLKELCDSVAKALKEITEYDRVMIYRFDADYNGEVFAESKEDHLEPFLGLHYPHTDIPAQARQLYIKNHLRIVGDVNYKSVPLYTHNSSAVNTLDLSLSVLRSVSPIHIEYLQNMGVGATLTVSLIHKGKLWGLIACHHYSPKYLSQEIRNTVTLHGHFITSQIDIRILNEEYEIARKANLAVDTLTTKNLNFHRNSLKELFAEDAIIQLCNSCGVSLSVDGKMHSKGDTPSDIEVNLLGDILFDFSRNKHFSTSELSRITSDIVSIVEKFPGINYYSLGDEHNYIIWYRYPTLKEINWAGDPSKSIVKKEQRLSPRKSFEKFTESVKNTSKPWLEAELAASSSFTNFLINHLRSIRTNEEKEKQKKLSEILKQANAELENINWISTHDLQEPLRKIRMMASTLLTRSDQNLLSDKVIDRITRMQSSAERMQTLMDDILKYTKTNNIETPDLETVNLNKLLPQIKESIYDTLVDAEASLEIKSLPIIKGIPFLLRQLFLNIIYNSIKFRKPNELPIITIHTITEERNEINQNGAFHIVEISDNGIGFNNEYKEKIFKIFSRLNSKTDYEGSGIGLALCKKIMIKHHGLIDAVGERNKGAKIRLYFSKI